MKNDHNYFNYRYDSIKEVLVFNDIGLHETHIVDFKTDRNNHLYGKSLVGKWIVTHKK